MRSGLWSMAVEDAVVLIVTVAVTASLPEMAAGWLAEQVGGSTAPDGPPLTAHVIAKFPVNPPVGAIVIVEMALDPGVAIMTGVPLSVKLGGVETVTAMFAVSTSLPAVPVTVTV